MAETVTTISQPYPGQEQFLQPGFQAALDQTLNNPQEYFPNSQVVPFSNQSQRALQMGEQRALAGSPNVRMAQQQNMRTMSGAYTNPWQSGGGQYQNQGYPQSYSPMQGAPMGGPLGRPQMQGMQGAPQGGPLGRPQMQMPQGGMQGAPMMMQMPQGGMQGAPPSPLQDPGTFSRGMQGAPPSPLHDPGTFSRGMQGAPPAPLQDPGTFSRGWQGEPTTALGGMQGGYQTDGQGMPQMGAPAAYGGQGFNKGQQGQYQRAGQGNPYLNQVAQSVDASIRPQIDSRAAMSGRLGSGANNESYSRAMSQSVAPYAFQNYENERGRQEAAVGQASALANQDYFDIGQLGKIGTAREGKAQEQIQDSVNRFNFGQQEPSRRAGDYLSQINGSYGQQTTRPSNAPSTGQNILSGALTGSSLLGDNASFWQRLLGAGAGGLLGGLF